MVRIDPEQERRRLTEFYAGQMDGELEKVAAQAYELTELAREVLRAEFSKRGLNPIFVEQAPIAIEQRLGPRPGDPPLPEPLKEDNPPQEGAFELRTMITLRQFRDLPEALLAKGCLDSAGIDSVLLDDNVIRMDWLWSNLVGGVKLKVEPSDAERATEILNQPIPETIDVDGIGECEQPHCPKCRSLDVTFKELNRPLSYASLFLIPIPVHRKAWRCHSCKVEWEDDGLPPAELPS
ncbi:MAG TPA: hypothetical protein VF123_09720 [Candidatus Sulfotelmatobacter sp.]